MIILAVVSAAIISTVYTLFLPNRYTATAMILPFQDERGGISSLVAGQLGGLAGLSGGTLGGPTLVDTYVTMLKSETVKDNLIARLKLGDEFHAKLRSSIYQILDRSAVFTPNKKDGIITISVNDNDPKRAADMANAYMDALGTMVVNLNETSAGRNKDFLEERLVKARGDLVKAEESLKQFQLKNKAVDIAGQTRATIEEVAKLKAKLADQEVYLATLRRKFTDSSQEVKTASANVHNLKVQLVKLENGSSDGALPSVDSIPATGQEYARLMRDVKMQEALVELLTKQYEVAQFSETKDLPPFQIIQKARVPDRKSGPNRLVKIISFTITIAMLSIVAVLAPTFIPRKPEVA